MTGDLYHLNCDRCGTLAVLRANIIGNGTRQYFWWCKRCKRITPQATYLKHDDVKAVCAHFGKDISEIPVLNNYAKDNRIRCAVCGAVGAEYHHWAPQSMREAFGLEWPQWPTAYLCKAHHDQWHKIVTPQLVKERT